MTEKYRNKYRVKSHRKPNWDYDKNGAYFITICTQNRDCNLSDIVNRQDHAFLQLSDFGKIVDIEWQKSFDIRDELFCDEYIIMPNHFHAIIILKKENDLDEDGNENENAGRVQTQGRASLPFHRLPKSISSFIAGFKSAVNSKIDDYIDTNNLDIPKYNRNNHFFQPNYHDSIIKNDESYRRIKQYIIENPKNWHNDKLKNKIDDD